MTVDVRITDYAGASAELHAVRDAVFVREQRVPVAIEHDDLDPLCRHAIARDAEGRAIATGRLVPPLHGDGAAPTERPPHARIGRMAVLAPWRARGVGAALLHALVDEARRMGWRRLELHAQVPVIGFYSRFGFLPYGPRFFEAGIEHQSMRRRLDGPDEVDSHEAALAAWHGVIAGGRRELVVYSRDLDPGQLDQPPVLAALRRFAASGARVRILLQDPVAARAAPLIALAQRLPTAIEFRAVEDPTDRAYPSAYAANDRGAWFFRPLGHRFEGEARHDDAVRARQLRQAFDPVWERARPCTEFRALGL